jgi:hypothetical protein
MITREQELLAALLWLRNHYEVGDPKDHRTRSRVLERIDLVIGPYPIGGLTSAGMEAFRSKYSDLMPASAVMPTSASRAAPASQPYDALISGAFYWVVVAGCESLVPARFTGVSGGSPPRPTWDFVGKPSAEEDHEVTWVGPQILMEGA